MTAVEPTVDETIVLEAMEKDLNPPYHKRLWRHARDNRLSVMLVSAVLAIAGTVSAWNMSAYPVRFKDEGVYMAQAWAVQFMGQLSPETYWYDHPPMGWLQLSGWTFLTQAFERYQGHSTMAGREFMLVVHLVACLLVFVLARRIGVRRFWATAGMLLYALSPLVVHFGRYVLLDNIAITWLLMSFVLALTPGRKLVAVAGSAACFAMVVLTKETMIVMAPALLYALLQHFRATGIRRYAMTVIAVLTPIFTVFYLLYAILKGELIPGEGHVSLVDAIRWQLSERASSGSVFEPGSDARNLVNTWLQIDPWLLGAGVVALIPGLFIRRLRPFALALAFQLAVMLRPGYLPFMYVIGMLPFAALLVVGVLNKLGTRQAQATTLWQRISQSSKVVVVLALIGGFCFTALPAWSDTIHYQATTDADRSQREALDWVAKHVPHDAQVVVEGEHRLDLMQRGFTELTWVYKLDTDQEVMDKLGGIKNIDYLVLSETTIVSGKEALPVVTKAVEVTTQVATFGEGGEKIVVLKTTV